MHRSLSNFSSNLINLDLEYKLLRERNLHAVHLCCHYIQDYEELAINHHLSLDSTNTTYYQQKDRDTSGGAWSQEEVLAQGDKAGM